MYTKQLSQSSEDHISLHIKRLTFLFTDSLVKLSEESALFQTKSK